ncbi:MAG: hypothetical protein CL878_08895 [Dehalococcoidia bacterium]|nr:hypothetical protein [Dehalococcoidia bacterium]
MESRETAQSAAQQWYKGELHFHCERSTIPEMLATYRRRRYDFCISTEHDAVHQLAPYRGPDGLCHSDPARTGAGRPLLLMGGSEMSLTIPRSAAKGAAEGMPVHVGAFPLRAPVEKSALAWPTLDRLRQLARPPIIAINHPRAGGLERHWSEADVIEAIAHGATHLELNPRNHGIELSLRLWDAVLSQGHQVYGILTNDAHEMANIGRYGATLVQATALTAEAIVAGLRQGACYALESGCRARLRHVLCNSQEITANATDAQELHFIGAKGRTLHVVYAEEGHYQASAEERYVRIEAVDDNGRRLFTQPVWLDEHQR